MKIIISIVGLFFLVSCATLTNDSHVPVALSLSNGESGTCSIKNKREAQMVEVPATIMVRRSDDLLQYDCETESGKKVSGGIESTMGGKIIASAVFLDFGIVDSITDKHREYPASFVIPVTK